MGLFLAQLGDDYRWVGGIILAVIYVAGHIAQMLKKKQGETGGTKAPPAPSPRRSDDFEIVGFPPEPETPAPPRRPEPPRRPQPVARPPRERGTPPRNADRPAPRRPAQRGTPQPRPTARTTPQPAPPSQRPARLDADVERPEPTVAPIKHLAHATFPQAHHDLHELRDVHAAPPAAGAPQPSLPRNIVRVLRNRSGLAGALVLSEILAPPVGLRDNHLG